MPGELKTCKKHNQPYYSFCSPCLFEPITVCKIQMMQAMNDVKQKCEICGTVMTTRPEFDNSN